MPVVSCDPLRVWSRLEPRPRQVELDGAIEARIHDPLWMLTRQWQFGEFKGEDTGSAVMATLARRTSPVVQVRVGATAAEAYDPSRPLEARVEQLPIPFPAPLRAQLAGHLTTLLTARLSAATDLPAVRRVLRQLFPLDPPAAGGDPVAQARASTAGLGGRVQQALAGRVFDGVKVAAALRPGMTVAQLPVPLVAAVAGHDIAPLLAALDEFRTWFQRLYAQPSAPRPDGWDGARLGYDYSVGVVREGGDLVELAGAATPSGQVDWFCFDVTGTTAAPSGVAEPAWHVTSAIPGPVQFAGMPNQRWWRMEDADVNLGHLRADATDLAKIIVTEFALLYGNNWLVVPYVQPVGTLAEIAGIVVTDVFGHRTLVKAATGSSGDDWSAWDLFSLSARVPGLDPLNQHLFLPPVVAQAGNGPILEEAAFLRDENANMVWAIETRVPDGLGGGRDGSDAARRLTAALSGPVEEPERDGGLRFVLGTTVPENWIPFVPVHTGEDNHSIALQRGWTPRIQPPGRVRPVTSILRSGIAADDTVVERYLVHEERVPRVGVRVQSSMQRARWVDGSTVVWYGRSTVSGRGEGSSGLLFDVLARS